MKSLKVKVKATKRAVGRRKTALKGRAVVKLFPTKKKKVGVLSPRKQEELILSHRIQARKLARSILRKWHARLDIQEVDSIVDLSLCEAVRRYNPAFGASFITFLFYHMRGNLIRAISDAATLNLVPVTDAELEGTLNAEAMSDRRQISAIEVADALSGDDSLLPDETLFKKELLSLSTDACEKLDSLEREVILRIYLKEQQLIDVATELGYSRCHISRVKKKALETLYGDMARSLELDPVRPSDDEVTDEVGERRESKKVQRRKAHTHESAVECAVMAG